MPLQYEFDITFDQESKITRILEPLLKHPKEARNTKTSMRLLWSKQYNNMKERWCWVTIKKMPPQKKKLQKPRMKTLRTHDILLSGQMENPVPAMGYRVHCVACSL